MRIETKQIKIFTFKEASQELKDKIRDHFSSDYDFYSHYMDERIETLKALASALDASLDYSLSCVPDRGEYIKFSPKNDELNLDSLKSLIEKIDYFPLTGVCYDYDFLEHLDVNDLSVDALNNASNEFIRSIHNEYESMLTDENLEEHCECNGYEFTEDGRIY